MERKVVTTAEAIAAIKLSAKRHLDARMDTIETEYAQGHDRDGTDAQYILTALEAHRRNLAALEVCIDMEGISAFLSNQGLEDIDIFNIVAEAFVDIRDTL